MVIRQPVGSPSQCVERVMWETAEIVGPGRIQGHVHPFSYKETALSEKGEEENADNYEDAAEEIWEKIRRKCMKVYYEDETTRIRSMEHEDAKVIFDTYMSYEWHPVIETYEKYYREQEAGERLVFIPEYNGKIAGICTLVLSPTEGPFAEKEWPERIGRAHV